MEIDTIGNAETQSHDASAADMIRDIDQRLQQLRQQEWQLSQNPTAAPTEQRTIRDDIRNLTHLRKDLTALVNRPEVSVQSQSPDLQARAQLEAKRVQLHPQSALTSNIASVAQAQALEKLLKQAKAQLNYEPLGMSSISAPNNELGVRAEKRKQEIIDRLSATQGMARNEFHRVSRGP